MGRGNGNYLLTFSVMVIDAKNSNGVCHISGAHTYYTYN